MGKPKPTRIDAAVDRLTDQLVRMLRLVAVGSGGPSNMEWQALRNSIKTVVVETQDQPMDERYEARRAAAAPVSAESLNALTPAGRAEYARTGKMPETP